MCPRIGWWAGCVAGLGCGAGCHSQQGRLIQPAHLSPPCRQGDPSHPPPAAILLRGLRKVFPSRGGGAAEKARRHRACCPPFAAACWRCASCRIQLQLGARVTAVTPPPPPAIPASPLAGGGSRPFTGHSSQPVLWAAWAQRRRQDDGHPHHGGLPERHQRAGAGASSGWGRAGGRASGLGGRQGSAV